MATTRELEIVQVDTGEYFFTITDDGKIIFQSEPYPTADSCSQDGMDSLDVLHESRPVRFNHENG